MVALSTHTIVIPAPVQRSMLHGVPHFSPLPPAVQATDNLGDYPNAKRVRGGAVPITQANYNY
jgi:hypothetical protein